MGFFLSKGRKSPEPKSEEIVVHTVVNGYTLRGDFPNISGGARWDAAEKDGQDWFIKEFMSPVLPPEHAALDDDYRQACERACSAFRENKERLYGAVRAANTGTLVAVTDFFLSGSHFYSVSPWIDTLSLSIPEIASHTEADKALLLKVLANTLASIHKNHVVHGDLRPDNIVFKHSPSGKLTLKLIDFDCSYVEGYLPEPEDLAISPGYISPEVGRVVLTEEMEELDCKSDVFSAGLLFHQLWCGESVGFDETHYDYPFEVVLDGGELRLSSELKEELRPLLEAMLDVNKDCRPTMAEVLEKLKTIFPAANASGSKAAPSVILREKESSTGLKITSSF